MDPFDFCLYERGPYCNYCFDKLVYLHSEELNHMMLLEVRQRVM